MNDGIKFLKPHGPWGSKMEDCIPWVKRNRPKIENPGGYCAAIAEKQGFKRSQLPQGYESNLEGLTPMQLREALYEAKGSVQHRIRDLMKAAAVDAPGDLITITDDEIVTYEFYLHSAEVTPDVLRKAIDVEYEMVSRGFAPGDYGALSEEVNFWLREHGLPYMVRMGVHELWKAFPETLELPDGVEAYIGGSVYERGYINPLNPVEIRFTSSERSVDTEKALIKSVRCNGVRERLRLTWDTTYTPGLKLYKAGGERNDDTQLYKPLDRGVAEPRNANQVWFDFAVHGLEDGLQVQPGFDKGVQIHYTRDNPVAYDQGERISFPYGNELEESGLSSALMFANIDSEGVTHLWDIFQLNGEDISTDSYVDRYAKLKEIIKETPHWKVVESYPISTKSGYDQALVKLADSSPVIRYNITGETAQVEGVEQVMLKACPYTSDPSICDLRGALKKGDVAYPVECGLAGQYRCGYLKAILYEVEY